MDPDDFENMPDDQLWAGLQGPDTTYRAEILDELSSRQFDRSDWDEASSLYEAAARSYLEQSRDRPAAYALFNQAQCLVRLSRTDDAVAVFDHAADLLRTAGEEVDIGDCLSRSAYALSRDGRDAEAIERWASAERLFAANDNSERAGHAAMSRGEALGRQGLLSESLEAFRQARDHFRGSAPAQSVAWADDRAAASLIELGRLQEAIDLLRGCLHVAQVGGLGKDHAYAAFRLGWTLCIKGDYSEALTHLTVAREKYSALDDLWGCARCDEQAANALSNIGDHEQAEGLYLQARSVFDALGNSSAAYECDVNRAVMYSGASRFEEAIALNERVLERLTDDEDWLRQGVVSRLANDLCSAGRPEEALDLLDRYEDSVPRDEVHERGMRMSARASALQQVGRNGEARQLADAGLLHLAGTDYPLLRAQFYETRGLAREAEGDSEFLRDLAYAVALFLACDATSRARDLSRRFLPDDGSREAFRFDEMARKYNSPEDSRRTAPEDR